MVRGRGNCGGNFGTVALVVALVLVCGVLLGLEPSNFPHTGGQVALVPHWKRRGESVQFVLGDELRRGEERATALLERFSLLSF